mmetsp:Transcript_10166/g.46553  ORF Transcript_10166/g.46553 Transcript_10166/m.46553 type:complete len:241 (+) Transcript_10166:1049-1771(+)
MRSFRLPNSARADAGRRTVRVRGLNVRSFASSTAIFAATASLECRPAFLTLRLKGCGPVRGFHSLGADDGRPNVAVPSRPGVLNDARGEAAAMDSDPKNPVRTSTPPRAPLVGVEWRPMDPPAADPPFRAVPSEDSRVWRSMRSCWTRSRRSAAVMEESPEPDASLVDSLCLLRRFMISPRRSSVSRPLAAAAASAAISADDLPAPPFTLKLSIARRSSQSLMSASICSRLSSPPFILLV